MQTKNEIVGDLRLEQSKWVFSVLGNKPNKIIIFPIVATIHRYQGVLKHNRTML